MLPISIQKRFESPGKLERDFLNYLKRANAPIDQSKTIGYEVLYHSVLPNATNTVDFFTGQLVQNFTNIRGSFVRPSSEHFVIYGMKGYYEREVKKGFTSTDAFTDTPEPTLINSSFSFLNNGIRVLRHVPLTEFDNENFMNDRGVIYLDQPILWQGMEEIKLTLSTNDPNQTFADQPRIRFDLLGLGLI